jgi:dTDP-4-amino-4,6-dideoxygalactose transaminase
MATVKIMAAPRSVEFNKLGFVGNEQKYIAQAIGNAHISGDGQFTKLCHQFLEEQLGSHKVLLTTSCTHALEMAAILLDLHAGDEVIVPSFTFVSTVNAFVLRGVTPIFADVRPDTFNLDETKLAALITPRTKAIVVVHYAGVACDMDAILSIANQHGIPVVEDNAHGLFGKYKGHHLGTLGVMSTQSFHETKNFTCGEGGALLINAERYAERAEIIREKGTNRSRFFRGQVDKYTWVDIGSSFLPSDMLAAFLYAQFEAKDWIQTKRERIWTYYHDSLGDWAQTNNVRLPSIPAYCEQPYHMYYLVMPSLAARTAFIAHMRERSVGCVFHYLPLHSSEMGLRFGGAAGACPVTEWVSDRLVRLPFHNQLTPFEQEYVVNAIHDFHA